MERGGERREENEKEAKKWKGKEKSVPKTIWKRCENMSPIPNCIICKSQILFIFFNQYILQQIYTHGKHT